MAKNYALKIAEGVTAKLNFDFSCNRGHSFGEYYIHGVVNEIISSNIDPSHHRVHVGYAHPLLQVPGNIGRPREVDFLLQKRESEINELYAEVKWVGSSHCTPNRILYDLCRLQIIKNNEEDAMCLFVVAGERREFTKLFKKSFLQSGTRGLLHWPGSTSMNAGAKQRVKTFPLKNHPEYQEKIEEFKSGIGADLPRDPSQIATYLTYQAISAPDCSRFNTLVWQMKNL